MPSNVYQRLSEFERHILSYVLQRPDPKFKLGQTVVCGKSGGVIVGFRYQSLKACFADGNAYIGWHYYLEDKDGDVDRFYENNLEATIAVN
jgi:hypothetical protein